MGYLFDISVIASDSAEITNKFIDAIGKIIRESCGQNPLIIDKISSVITEYESVHLEQLRKVASRIKTQNEKRVSD
jgi:hypothetical protein